MLLRKLGDDTYCASDGVTMWRARPIFISSTFADMQAERDHLRNFVFPELEERLRLRQQNLEWVDLRVGVATASLAEGEARELQVLKVCLNEVKRCRPFLIVLLGDRYGWVPPADRIDAAALEAGLQGDFVGRSVTDLEISFGAFGESLIPPRSFFYFREPLPYKEMPPSATALYTDTYDLDPQAVQRADRLSELKRSIEDRLPHKVRRYAARWDQVRQRVVGLESWGRQVVEDIWAELDAETPSDEARSESSWEQREREALDAYVADRSRGFAGREKILAGLLEFALSLADDGARIGACLVGEPGSGKSAIFGELLRRLRDADALVLAHAAGASVRSSSVEAMLRRWIEELATALNVPSLLADDTDADTIVAAFVALLSRATVQRRVVLLVDALDQFDTTTQGRFATWLPQTLPNNARFIATAIPGEATEALGRRRWMHLQPLTPINESEAREITEAICARYHRTLEQEVMSALLAKRSERGFARGNPLWLVLAVEELNLLDADDFDHAKRTYVGAPAEQIRALMLDKVADQPTEVRGLFQAGFEHAGELFGTPFARAFIGFTSVSRSG